MIQSNKQKLDDILIFFKDNYSEKNRIGMSRYGIKIENAYGLNMPILREIAKLNKKNHELSLLLWETCIHEARILASIIADPEKATPELVEHWVSAFNSWDLCDQCCAFFVKTSFAFDLVPKYVQDEREFYRRTAFSLIARLAVNDKKAQNERFYPFFELIEKHSADPRNMVKKSVNWALRQLGKRNHVLLVDAQNLAWKLKNSTDKTSQWIGSDAYRELNDRKILARIKP